MAGKKIEIPFIIGGKEIKTDNLGMPHDHGHVLATYHKAGPDQVRLAIDTALAAQKMWQSFRWEYVTMSSIGRSKCARRDAVQFYRHRG